MAVVCSHSEMLAGYFGNAEIAVKFFFMISGFLISFVLHKDAAYGSAGTFYLNRALRLYPAYWVMALAMLVWWCVDGAGLATFRSFNAASRAVLVVSNLLIFGQDVVMFLKPTAAGVTFTRNFLWSEPQLWRGLLDPPAWSLGLELSFYVIAPFVVRRVRLTAALAAASMALGYLGLRHGFANGPFSYRFFPFEISLFLVGALSERFLLPRARELPGLVRWSPIAAAVPFALYNRVLPYAGYSKVCLSLAGFAVLLPFLFLFQHGRRWDNWLGNLSYPVYIGHYLALILGLQMAGKGWPGALAGVALTAGFSFTLEYGVNRPVEVLRKQVRRRAAPMDSA